MSLPATPRPAAIEARRLVKRFGDFTAVGGVTFEVSAGEVFGLLGPNGAGKTTTIRMLCGLLEPTGGTARVAGYDVAEDPWSVKANLGYMSQKFSLYEDLTVEQNLDFFSAVYGVGDDRRARRKQEVLEMAGLVGRERELVASLSGGWRQRLALGTAVLHEPPVLFLDEPTAGVDPRARRSFWELIYALSGRGTTTLVTTHYMDEAENCSRVALIDQGLLVALGTPAELRRRPEAGGLLEVEADPLEEAYRTFVALRERESLGEIAFFGRTLHLRVPDPERTVPRIRRAIEERGIRLHRIGPIPPSLEDVFIALLKGRPPGAA